MIFMFVISFVIFAYEILSLVLPLRISGFWKVIFALVLLVASMKNYLFQKFGGGMFFAPDLPREAVLVGSVLYNFLIVALFLLIAKDLLLLVWKILGWKFPVNAASLIVCVLAVLLTCYGTYEAVRVPDVETHEIALKNLPEEFDGFKFAMLVDLHASSLNRRDLIEAIVTKTNDLQPDIVLIPGDFVDGLVSQRRQDLQPLENLRAKFGVLGTTGNHEYYSGCSEWLRELQSFGVKFLDNQVEILSSADANLVIAGVPDKQGIAFGFAAPDINHTLENIPEDSCVILMDHRPENALENSRAGVDLQISGHTHGGMMPGLAQIVAMFNSGFVKGWYDVGEMKLYVSKGTSLWNGFPVRILDPAEITLFILRKI